MSRETVNIVQAADRCGVARRTVHAWVKTDKVQYVRTAGGHVRIFVDSLFVKGNVAADGEIGHSPEDVR